MSFHIRREVHLLTLPHFMDEDTEAQGASAILRMGLVGPEVGASFLPSPSTQSPRSWGIQPAFDGTSTDRVSFLSSLPVPITGEEVSAGC